MPCPYDPTVPGFATPFLKCMSDLMATYDVENVLISWGTDFGFQDAPASYADIDSAIALL